MVSPGWSAWMVQVPPAVRVMVAPFTPPAVQTVGVVVVNETGRPEVASAVAVTGELVSGVSAIAVNVIV